MKLIETALFHHMDEPELSKTLALLNAAKRAFKKNEFIFTAGLCAPILSVVLSGSVSIITEDYWGSRSIIGMAHEGDIFCESFVLSHFSRIPVSVVANEPTAVLLLDYKNQPGLPAAFYHNLLEITSQKNIALTQKISHMSRKTLREKILSYLSAEAQRQGASSFFIPFDRQGLADYLSVDRSALSHQLSLLQKDGLIEFYKNSFKILS